MFRPPQSDAYLLEAMNSPHGSALDSALGAGDTPRFTPRE